MAKRVSSRETFSPSSTTGAAPKAARSSRPRTKKTTPDTETISEMLVKEQAEPVSADAVALPEILPVAEVPTAVAVAATTDQIAKLAYNFWQERGCPISSGEEDWFRAERELQYSR